MAAPSAPQNLRIVIGGVATITNLSQNPTADDTAIVTWDTDVASDSLVEWGTTTDYGNQQYSATLTRSHSIEIGPLIYGSVPGASTTYHLRVTSGGSSSPDLYFAYGACWDDTVINNQWVVDRFTGNDGAGLMPFQGIANEVGGMRRVMDIKETPWGMLVASGGEYLDAQEIYIVKNSVLRTFMEREGAMEGPIELCQSGLMAWNTFDNSLYLTGPYCIRKVYRDTDGRLKVKIVAGSPYTRASTTNCDALDARFQRCYGFAAQPDGTLYWLESGTSLRKFEPYNGANGWVTTLNMNAATGESVFAPLGTERLDLAAGEDANTLYLADYMGEQMRCINLATAVAAPILGNGTTTHHELDGPPLVYVTCANGVRGVYHPGYNAIIINGHDGQRWRWAKRSGDQWVRNIISDLLTASNITALNSTGVAGNSFRLLGSNPQDYWHPRMGGIGTAGGVYISNTAHASASWRAYVSTLGTPTQPIGNTTIGGASRIHAAFLNADGEVTDAIGRIAAVASGVQINPRIAYFGGVYLVVWAEIQDGSYSIYGARIEASSGDVLDSPAQVIYTGARTQGLPDVAADDQGFVVVWGGYQAGDVFCRVMGRTVNASTFALGTVQTLVSYAGGPRIAWNASSETHLVVFTQSGPLSDLGPTDATQLKRWLTMDHDLGNITLSTDYYISPGGISGARGYSSYSLCAAPSAGDGWTMITDNEVVTGVACQRAVNILPDRTLGSTDVPTSGHPAGGTAYSNWLAWHFDAALEDRRPWGLGAVCPADATQVVAVWPTYHTGSAVYQENSGSVYDGDLYAARLTDGWSPEDAHPGVEVATGTETTRNPTVASDGSGNLVLVYEKWDELNPQIIARKLTCGESLTVDATETVLAEGESARSLPAIAYGASGQFCAVWEEGWRGDPVYEEYDVVATDTTTLQQDGGILPEHISLYLPGTFPTTAKASLRYKLSSLNNWTQGHDLYHIQNLAGVPQVTELGFAWTIFDLTPGSSYDIEVVVRDSATMEATVYTATMTTRTLPAAAGTPNKTITAGSSAAQIQAAFDDAEAGDVIQFENGTYTVSSLQMTVSGSEESPIYIRGASRAGVVLQDATGTILHFEKVSHIVFENMTMEGSGVDSGTAASSTGITLKGATSPNFSTNITLRNLTISGVDSGIEVANNDIRVKQLLVYDCTLNGNDLWTQDLYCHSGSGAPLSDLTQYKGQWSALSNYVTGDLVYDQYGWEDGAIGRQAANHGYRALQASGPGSAGAKDPADYDTGDDINTDYWEREDNIPDDAPDIYSSAFYNDKAFSVPGYGNAIFNNTIDGFGDALGLYSSSKGFGIHFYRNEVLMAGDDGLNTDCSDGSRNLTWTDNRLTNSMTFISGQSNIGGPTIVARNIGINIGRQVLKYNGTNEGLFVYNNTVLKNYNSKMIGQNRAIGVDGGYAQYRGALQNNIFMYFGSLNADGMAFYFDSRFDAVDVTHNSYYPSGTFRWNYYDSTARTLANEYAHMASDHPATPVFDIRQRHYQDNICEASPFETPIVLGSDFLTKITTLYNAKLAETMCRHSGVPIYGITDGYAGAAPDRGAIITGRTIPTYGDRS